MRKDRLIALSAQTYVWSSPIRTLPSALELHQISR